MPYILPSPQTSPLMRDLAIEGESSSSISQMLNSEDAQSTTSSSSSGSSNFNSDDDMSSPPTPCPPIAEVADDKASSTTSAQFRPFRNHVRSHSHDAVAGLSRSSTSSSSSLSQMSNYPIAVKSINVLPSSPTQTRATEVIKIATPVITDSSPKTRRLSLFTIGQPSTDWPEGDANDAAESIGSESPSEEQSEPLWKPTTADSSSPSTSFPFGGVVSPLGGTTPKASSPQANINGHAPRSRSSPGEESRLRIDVRRPRSGVNSPLPTPMVRKKSGELVRSSLKSHPSFLDTDPTPTNGPTRQQRAKSAPATPTGPKAVHFDKQLEHVKLFLAQQRPAAVSRNGSPGETTEEDSEAFPFPTMNSVSDKFDLLLPNFPSAPNFRNGRDCYVQSLELHQDTKSLRGKVWLANISFHKHIAIRFTLDDWQTVSEVSGEYLQPGDEGGDVWIFSIKLADMLARLEEKKMYLAVRYHVGGQEIWDNNNGSNYLLQFKKDTSATPRSSSQRTANKYQWAVTNSGQASERMADLRRELDRLVSDEEGLAPAILPNTTGAFSTRYDFGASLRQKTVRNASAPDVTALGASNAPYFHRNNGTLPVYAARQDPPKPKAAAPSFARFERDGVVSTDYAKPSFASSASGPQNPSLYRQSSDLPPQTRTDRFHSFPPSRKAAIASTVVVPTPAVDLSTPTSELFSVGSSSSISGSDLLSPTNSPPRSRTWTGSHSINGRPRSPPPGLPDFTTPPSSVESSAEGSYSSPLETARSPSPDSAYLKSLPSLNGSDEPQTYTGFLERYCFFQPETRAGNALGLNPYGSALYQHDIPTPRARNACSTSFLSSPHSSSGDSTPSSGRPHSPDRVNSNSFLAHQQELAH